MLFDYTKLAHIFKRKGILNEKHSFWIEFIKISFCHIMLLKKTCLLCKLKQEELKDEDIHQ